MGREALEDAERLLQENLASVEDVLETYGAAAMRHGRFPELVELVEASSPSGRWAVAQWIQEADLRNGGAPDAGVDAIGRQFVDAADLLSDPESLRVPDPILPGIAWPGELTLFSGKPKVAGKTSILTAGCYAVATGGRFLGERAQQGKVLWVLAEGSRTHVGRYLAQIRAELPPDQFKMIRPGMDPIEDLRGDLQAFPADLVVVDSLSPWFAPLGVDIYTDEVVGPLAEVYRIADDGPSIVLIHHTRKADDDPAGSHKIKALPDVVRTLKRGDNDRERVIKGRGRWGVRTIRYRMETTGEHDQVPELDTVRFSRVDPDREVEEKVLDFLEAHDGPATKRAIREGVDARASEIDRALRELEREGVIEVDRSGAAHLHRIAR